MKTIFTLLSFLFVNQKDNPKDEIFKIINKAFLRSAYNSPKYENGDSCYFYYYMIKMEVSKKYEVNSITVSDEAPEWVQINIRKFIKRLTPYTEINNLLQKGHYKNCSLVIPVVIESVYHNCKYGKTGETPATHTFNFQGKALEGKIVFLPTIFFEEPNHSLRKT